MDGGGGEGRGGGEGGFLGVVLHAILPSYRIIPHSRPSSSGPPGGRCRRMQLLRQAGLLPSTGTRRGTFIQPAAQRSA